MSAFVPIFTATVRQLADRTRMLGFGLLNLVPAGLMLALAQGRDAQGLDTDMGVLMVAPFFSIVVPITAVILAGAALGDERRDRTLSFLVLRPVRRITVVAAKTAAAVAVSAGLGVVGAAALVLAYAAVGGSVDVLPAVVAGVVAIAVLYGAIFVLVGSLFSRSTLVGVVYVLFVEGVMVQELSRLSGLSLWRRGLGATLDLMPTTFPARALLAPLRGQLPSLWNASLLAAAIVALTVVVGSVLLARTDSV